MSELAQELQSELNYRLAADPAPWRLEAAVRFYTDCGYNYVAWRMADEQQLQEPPVRSLLWALCKLTVPAPQPITVYRGAGFGESARLFIALFRNGERRIVFDRLVSTSLSRDIAYRFREYHEDWLEREIHTFMLKLTLPPGYPIIYAAPLSTYPEEEEIVLFPAEFEVVGITTTVNDSGDWPCYHHTVELRPISRPALLEQTFEPDDAWLEEQARFYNLLEQDTVCGEEESNNNSEYDGYEHEYYELQEEEFPEELPSFYELQELEALQSI